MRQKQFNAMNDRMMDISRLPELECFNAMLLRLFREECQHVVERRDLQFERATLPTVLLQVRASPAWNGTGGGRKKSFHSRQQRRTSFLTFHLSVSARQST